MATKKTSPAATKRKLLAAERKAQIAKDVLIVGRAVMRGVCPCSTNAENPGPSHLTNCKFSDPSF